MKKNDAIVVVIASDIEMRQTARRMVQQCRETQAGAVLITGVLAGRECVLVKTGVGAKKASSAARLIAQRYAPACVLIAGAAGAADPALNVGDIVVADTVMLQSGQMFPCHVTATRTVRAVLMQAALPVRTGSCLTVDRFIHRKQTKEMLFERFSAPVLDMESGALCRRLYEAGVPFVNVRVVSDTARQDTADMERLYARRRKGGFIAAGLHCIRQPSDLFRAARLMKDVRRVSTLIADAVALLVPCL